MASLLIKVPNFDQDTLLEAVGDIDPGPVTMSLEDASAPKVFRVVDGWPNRYDAALFMLGCNWVEYPSGGDPILRREIPFRHPDYPNFYCKKVTLMGQFYQGKNEIPGNEPEWKRPNAVSKYKDLLINADFGPLPYDVKTDDEITTESGVRQEWKRYTRVLGEPAIDVLTVEGNAYKWAEGSGTGGQPSSGTAIDARFSFAIPERKADITVMWYYVPQEWTHDMDNSEALPTKLQANVGTVNSAVFFNNPAGTLLFDSYDVQPVYPPFQTTDWSVYKCNHITMRFKFFDPEKGVVSSYRGHNLLPYRTDGGDAKYYYAVANVTGGQPIYASYDFTELFSHWSV